MRRILLIAACLFSAVIVNGQDKLFTIDEAVVGSWMGLAPKTISAIQWKSTSQQFTFNSKDSVFVQGVADVKPSLLFTLADLNSWLKNANLSAMKRVPSIQWITPVLFMAKSGAGTVFVNVVDKKVERTLSVSKEAENIDYRPDFKAVAYTEKNNLFVTINGTEPIAVTSDSNAGIVNGQTVHRNEFGISKGTYWSPKGNLLAFYRMDETMVTDYPLVDITTRIATATPIKYPMAGMTSHHVTVGVYNPATKITVFLKTGEPLEHYLTNVSWTPDEKYILLAELNRGQNHMSLNMYDAVTGDFVRTLFEEKNARYVEPSDPAIFFPNEPNAFVWQSQRDGYNHLYKYDLSGKLLGEITKGNWIVLSFLGFTADGKEALFTSTIDSPLEVNLCKVNLKSKKVVRLTKASGVHSPQVNLTAGLFIDRYSSITVPNRICVSDFAGKEIKELIKAENPLAAYKMPEMKIFTIKAGDDSTDLYCRMIKPIDFDSTKKYPVVVYVYGGPHAQLVTNRWLGGTGLWDYHMAQKGYIMFTVDNRGSANRGFDFESVIHRNLGVNEMADQMRGIQYLFKLPYVDTARVGVHGWSFGGFMTTQMMLKENKIFKVGVAGGPVIDWSLYEVMYGERYMDTPDENPEGYKSANMLNYVENLKGKLMLIHGDIDNTVVLQHSLKFLKECVDKKVMVDYFIYPQHEHNVGGYDRIHLMRKVTDYFDTYLKR